MIELNGQLGELKFTVEIKRKATGEVETYELVGYLNEDKLKEIQHGCNTFHSGS
jgi:hypothetical protein